MFVDEHFGGAAAGANRPTHFRARLHSLGAKSFSSDTARRAAACNGQRSLGGRHFSAANKMRAVARLLSRWFTRAKWSILCCMTSQEPHVADEETQNRQERIWTP